MSKFSEVAAEIGALVTEKNAFYGNSFAKCGDFLRLLWPNGIAPEQYGDALAMVRIFDKQMRIATAKDALGESPYRDIAGYGILGAVKDAAAHKAPSLCDSEDARDTAAAYPYTFPAALKYMGMLSSDYVVKLREEVDEVSGAHNPIDRVIELLDVIHVAETGIRSHAHDHGLDVKELVNEVIRKNSERGYYQR